MSEQDYSSRDTLQNEAATTSIEALARLRIAIPVLLTPIRLEGEGTMTSPEPQSPEARHRGVALAHICSW